VKRVAKMVTQWTHFSDADLWCVVLPLRLVSEANQRGHWRVSVARKKLQRTTCRVIAMGCSVPREKVRRVLIVRMAPRLLDTDNAVGSAKACRDGIADAFGRGDGPSCGIEWAVTQQQGPLYGVHIVVST